MELGKVAIRQTCDACNASKVKCDGGNPCKRCQKRGTQCFYRPKKRRPKASNNNTSGGKGEIELPLSDFTPTIERTDISKLPKSLNEHERRIWSVFFTLFRNFTRSCSAFWFSHQLRKMLSFLQESNNYPAQERFQAWLSALNIDVNANLEHKCQIDPSMVRLHVLPPAGGIPVVQDINNIFDIRSEAIAKKLPMLQLSESGVVTANNEFVDFFGVTAEDLKQLLQDSGGGLLPWGGDLICRIIPRESDIISFIQILAIKINSLGKPKEIPCIRELPSIHICTVATKNDTRPCVIKCLHREIIALNGSTISISMQLLMTFTPVLDEQVKYENISMPVDAPTTDDLDEVFGDVESMDIVGTPSDSSQDLLPNDFLGDDERWLDELLDWVGTSKAEEMKPVGTPPILKEFGGEYGVLPLASKG